MDWLQLLLSVPWPVSLSFSILWLILGYAAVRNFLVVDEGPVPYEVEIPEPCKRGADTSQYDVVENASIKIPGSLAIQCYNPASGRFLGRVNPQTAAGIDRAIAKAHDAQKLWCQTGFSLRRIVLASMLRHILDHQDEIVTAACLDSGKARVDAAMGEVLVTTEKLAWTIKHGEKLLQPEPRGNSLLMAYKKNEVVYEPLGVVAALVSWNYPFHNLLNGIISAIFAGNGIVVKCSEQTCWSAQYYIRIAQGALTACGQDPNLIQLITCWPDVANHLTSHPQISHITFIGSRPVAHHVAASAAKSLTPVCVELGGKDPAIVLDDAIPKDLPRIASILMRGVFQSAGQNCIGIERVIATPKAYKALLPTISERVKHLQIGSALDEEDDVDVGASISAGTFDTLERLIAEAVAHGADLVHGGTRFTHPRHPKGHYFSPTLLAGVTSTMSIAQQELFAPIFVLMPAEDVDDAIRIANSTPYALGASVFGKSKKNLDKVVREVSAGMVAVNDFAAYYMCSMPFGGVRGSGYGRFGGAEGLRSLCNVKSVCRDRFPSLISTGIPARLDYPGAKREVGGKKKAWEFVKGIVGVGYEPDIGGKIGAIGKLIRHG